MPTAQESAPLISLCLIAGNVETFIERCLTSFKTLADEIIVVRAIGNQTPDRTLEIAASLGARTGEYINQRHPEFPHIDDFAAARNLSWDMARGHWLMWADTDDIIAPASAEFLRELILQKGDSFDVILTRYAIPDGGMRDNWRSALSFGR